LHGRKIFSSVYSICARILSDKYPIPINR